jgi:hypothetical protein
MSTARLLRTLLLRCEPCSQLPRMLRPACRDLPKVL